jgi:predicted metal-dependent hydrolase
LLDSAHPAVQALLLWHAAEEIEHKAVAFDVLREVAPSYSVRIAGFAIAGACLGGFWLVATRCLLAQDRITLRGVRRELRELSKRPTVRRAFLRSIRQYVKRDFHPWDHDNSGLAARHLDSLMGPGTNAGSSNP